MISHGFNGFEIFISRIFYLIFVNAILEYI